MTLSKSTKYLVEWFVRYTKNRDIVFRKISNISTKENLVIVEQKSGVVVHYVVESFPDDFLNILKSIKADHKGLIVYNSAENFEKLLKSWQKLSTIQNLTVYFVNPFSKTEKKWIINPYVHNKISDETSLKQGLDSMFIMVDSISKKEVEQLTC